MQTNPTDVILLESSDMIRKGYYQKAFKLLNKSVQDPSQVQKQLVLVQEQIQLSRRLLHVLIKLMIKCLNKFQDKLHRIQLLLVKSMEIVCNYFTLLQSYNDIILKLNDSTYNHAQYLMKILPTRRTSLNQTENDKGPVWMQFQRQNFFECLSQILSIQYLFHKNSRNHLDAQVCGLRMENLVIFSQKQQVPLWMLQIGGRLSHYLGNAQFENSQWEQANKDYLSSFEFNQQGMCLLLEDFQKHKTNSHKNYWHLLIKFTQQLILNLAMLASNAEHDDNFTHAVESLNLSQLISKVLNFIPSSEELVGYVQMRGQIAVETYQTYILQLADINKFMKQLYPELQSKEIFDDTNIVTGEFHKSQIDIYKKMNYKQLQGRQFIINKKPTLSIIPVTLAGPLSHYFFKGRQQGPKQKSLHYKNSSVSHINTTNNFSDTHYQGSTLIDLSKPSFDIVQTPGQSIHSPKSSFYSSNHKSFNRMILKPSDTPMNYITQLLNLRNKTYIRQDSKDQICTPNQLQIESEPEKRLQINKLKMKIKERKPVIPLLDKQVSAYIEQSIKQKYECLDMDAVNLKCKKHLLVEQEMRKELPMTKQVLGMQKEFGNGNDMFLIGEKDKLEFNKNLEFNILTYFDYLNSNQYSALASLQNKKEIKNMRLAQQKLLQSTGLVLKKNLVFPPEEKEKQINTQTHNQNLQLEQQTNSLTFNFDHNPHEHNNFKSNESNNINLQTIQKKVKKDSHTKEDQMLNEFKLAQDEKDRQAFSLKKAKEGFITYLGMNETQSYDIVQETQQLQQKLYQKKNNIKIQTDSNHYSYQEPSQLAKSTEYQSTLSRRHHNLADTLKVKQSINPRDKRLNIH